MPTTQRRATASLVVRKRRHKSRVCGGESSDRKKRQRDGCGSSGQAASRTQLRIPPLCAGVKYRKLLLYYSESWPSFSLSLSLSLPSSVCVCVEDFKLYLFFMAICMFKKLLQEYLKRQGHFFLLRKAVNVVHCTSHHIVLHVSDLFLA